MSKKILLILSMCLFISSCANRDATALSPHKTYTQYGKRYHVLHNSKNYQEKGLASWYGARFNKKRTSSGERFNMYKMTAAHKTLPLASRVKVTNLHNGKTVVVKINDRGPFVSNRVIDLSYAAAKKLGMVGRGTAAVSVTAM